MFLESAGDKSRLKERMLASLQSWCQKTKKSLLESWRPVTPQLCHWTVLSSPGTLVPCPQPRANPRMPGMRLSGRSVVEHPCFRWSLCFGSWFLTPIQREAWLVVLGPGKREEYWARSTHARWLGWHCCSSWSRHTPGYSKPEGPPRDCGLWLWC